MYNQGSSPEILVVVGAFIYKGRTFEPRRKSPPQLSLNPGSGVKKDFSLFTTNPNISQLAIKADASCVGRIQSSPNTETELLSSGKLSRE
jgi:hypothetical protein